MIKITQTLLFTTNLSDISRDAFSTAVILASQLSAKIVLLHVHEKLPESYDSRVRLLFGEKQWANIVENQFSDAKRVLIGKISTQQIIRAAMEQFCRENNMADQLRGEAHLEIVIKDGDVIETILEVAEEHHCEMIVMGASKGLVSGTTVGPHIKSVLKKAKVPVLVIPPKAVMEQAKKA